MTPLRCTSPSARRVNSTLHGVAAIAVGAALFFGPGSTPAQAWDDTGHQVVAFIAYQRLTPAAKQKVDHLFPMAFEDKIPSEVDFKERGFVFSPKHLYGPFTIANWMDDLRDNSYDNPLKDWHHINYRPLFAGIEPKLVVPNTVNVRERIAAMLNRLEPKNQKDDPATAESLGFLIHLVGDVHQPLHCATRYSPEHKNGDLGGNLFEIEHPSKNLHSFWDKGGGLFQFQTIRRPLKEAGRQQLADYAKAVTDAWPAEAHASEWKSLDTDDWIKESNGIARDFAYVKITPGAVPTDAYIEQTKAHCQARIAAAGYRLAEILNQYFQPHP